PFKEASKEMEAEDVPTLHLVLPWKLKLLEHLETEIANEKDEIKDLRCRALDFTNKKYFIHMYHKIATFLWPPFRHLKMLNEDERVEVMIQLKRFLPPSTPIESKASVSFNEPRTKMQKFSKWADFSSNEDAPDSNDNEIEIYKGSKCTLNCKIVNWWKEKEDIFPSLSLVAKKILCIPASSAASERNFSAAGFTLNHRRSQLNPDLVDILLFLKSNLKI
ncbi:Zinc finger BED domain-containing protein, partial [Ooceraea biroi]